MQLAFNDIPRLAFGFHNPNHAAAALCALLPLCWGGRRAWPGRVLSGGLFTLLLLTRSRTGLLVAACEGAAWWWVSRRRAARAAVNRPAADVSGKTTRAAALANRRGTEVRVRRRT